jgi:hypothetical protein
MWTDWELTRCSSEQVYKAVLRISPPSLTAVSHSKEESETGCKVTVLKTCEELRQLKTLNLNEQGQVTGRL